MEKEFEVQGLNTPEEMAGGAALPPPLPDLAKVHRAPPRKKLLLSSLFSGSISACL